MKHSLLSFLFCFCIWVLNAQYNASSVPNDLKKNAAVVTHLYNTNVEVEGIDKATIKVQKIFTVLNEEGKEELMFHQYCNKYISLDDAEIKVYDQKGKQTAKYKKKDLFTSAIGEGLVEDGYMSYYKITTPDYPVTVEFNYSVRLKSIISLPDFRFIGEKEAVVESNYTIKYPVSINVRYKPKLTLIVPQVSDDGKYKTCKWTVKNLQAMEDEEGSVSDREKFPHINIVADQFEYYSSKGDLSSWKNFGLWINSLYNGLDELPADRQQFFRGLVKDASNDEEKVSVIYHYLQENFRYVSIQLGIGGLKPFSAVFTDQKKYGDCKALSNYMKAALKAVGIRSHVAIINAEYNEEPVDADFPSNDFNHVILCVPQPKDSIWLECTSSTTEFNKLGTFTENRNALLITEEGGVLVPTPQSISSENTWVSHTIVKMEDDLSGYVETSINATGEYREMMSSISKEKKDDQKEIIVRAIGFKEPDDFVLEATEARMAQQTKLKMSLRKVPEFSAGDNYFFSARVNKLVSGLLPSANNRKLDFYFSFPFEKRDTTVIKLPSNFHPDTFPKEKSISNNYGSYQSKSWYNEKENSIYTATAIVLRKHKIAAADYPSVKSFFDEIAKDDAQRVVVKKTAAASTEKKAF